MSRALTNCKTGPLDKNLASYKPPQVEINSVKIRSIRCARSRSAASPAFLIAEAGRFPILQGRSSPMTRSYPLSRHSDGKGGFQYYLKPAFRAISILLWFLKEDSGI